MEEIFKQGKMEVINEDIQIKVLKGILKATDKRLQYYI